MTNTELTADPLAEVEITGGVTRSAFILKGTLAAASVYGVAAVGPFVQTALAAKRKPGIKPGTGGGGDVTILNFALTLEYLEADFYAKAASLGLSPKVKRIAQEFGSHEAAHVAAITSTITKLGGKPVAKPTFSFPDTNEASFLKLALTLEDTGVGAYNGAAPLILSPVVLAAAGSIVQIEARHAAVIRLQNGVTPAPAAFDVALQKAAVLGRVKPLIKA